MSSFYETAPYEVAATTYKFLQIKDFSTLRTANRHWRSRVNGILDKNVKNMARGLRISDHKSDLELEREMRVFVMCLLSLLERERIRRFPATSANIFRAFNMIQIHAISVNFPKLTLKILQMKRKRLNQIGEHGIITKLIMYPALYKESLKYLGKKVYKLRRMPLVDCFHNELDISYRRMSPLFWYNAISMLKSVYVATMKHHLKLFVGMIVYIETLRTAEIELTPFVLNFSTVLIFAVFLFTSLKYYRTVGERFENFLDD